MTKLTWLCLLLIALLISGCLPPEAAHLPTAVSTVVNGTQTPLPLYKIPDFSAQSPDGQLVAYESGSPIREIHLVRADGSNDIRLTYEVEGPGSVSACPKWSPDGQLIAFASGAGGGWQLFVMKKDGTAIQHIAGIRTGPVCDIYFNWSLADQTLAFVDSKGLFTTNSDGSGLRLRVKGWCFQDPTWATDGHSIDYTVSTCETGKEGHYQINLSNGNIHYLGPIR